MHVSRTNEARSLAPPALGAVASDSAPGPPDPSSAAVPRELGAGRAPGCFTDLLHGLARELDRGEDLTQKAIRGGSRAGASPEKLIALQAGIYRYSEAVDLASKLVDRGTQAVRTTLQNQ